MDSKAIQTDIKNYKIREGALYKRSKFLKEWRERWIVLTTNNLYTFTNKNCDEMTDVVDLKEIKSYKSYLRKDQEMIPPGFKIRSADDMMYFCAKNCHQKWSWIVTFERLMDYKYVGSSNYNNADWIKTKGFDSQIQFQSNSAKKPQQKPSSHPQSSPEKKSVQSTPSNEKKVSQKEVNQERQKLLKQIQEQQKQLDKRKFQFDLKQATIVTETKKITQEWAKIQEAKRNLEHLENQIKAKAQQQEHRQPQKKQQVKQEPPKQKPVTKPSQNTDSPQRASVAQLKNMFQKKAETSQPSQPYLQSSTYKKPVEKKQQDISIFRERVISSLFQQYRVKDSHTNAIKYATDFIINTGGDSNSGFASYVLKQAKSNSYNKQFAEIFVQFLSQYENFEKCQTLMKFFEVCFFEISFIFSAEQLPKIQKKMIRFLDNVKNEQLLVLVLKNMSRVNKNIKYSRAQIGQKLENIINQSKHEQTKHVAKKLLEDL